MTPRMLTTEPAPAHDGKPAWYGLYLVDGAWRRASSTYGPILYTTPEHALAGAAALLEIEP